MSGTDREVLHALKPVVHGNPSAVDAMVDLIFLKRVSAETHAPSPGPQRKDLPGS